MFRATLKLPVKVDVELRQEDIADAIEAITAPFLVGEHRGTPMRELITDLAGNVYRKPPGVFIGDLDPSKLRVVFPRQLGHAAAVDLYHRLKFQKLNHVGGDPAAELVRACKEVLEFADHGSPVHPVAKVVAGLRLAVAKVEGLLKEEVARG